MSAEPEPRPEILYSPERRNEETRTLTNLQKARFMLIKRVLEKHGLNPTGADVIAVMRKRLSWQHFYLMYKAANAPQLMLF